ncbi:RNA polymerase II subunit A C-terminal domain phosphatase isoform X2 [Cephus cinctus]|nr:RNA polymerase II subunit A C-terminal domain phosphatase isoform X2 [Cephus cinctus]
MKDLCAECGADLREENLEQDGGKVVKASVPMVHSIPELKVCPELAEKIGKEDEQRLLRDRKLALLVDLDQTIVHTTNDNVPPDMKDVYHYQLYGPNSPWYHTRLRPGTRHFLSEMSHLYELHICTFGARNYAHTVAALLDKDGVLFSHRILSRDECFDPASKTANLKALFPCGDDMVCIIDDREDVWQGCGNLVQVKPYHFFRHTGDIHAPPGLGKYDMPDLPETSDTSETFEKESQNSNTENGVSSDDTNVNAELDTSLKATEEVKETVEERNETDVQSEKNVEQSTKEETAATKEREKAEKPIEELKEFSTVKETANKAKTKESPKKDANPEKESITEDEDHDDYLMYLEDILRKIHAEFYANIDSEVGRKPLREIIPRVRARVLKRLCLTFSGLIATHQKLHQSRAYKVARSLGAEVTQDLTERTTHLVAIKPGTAKANAAKKNPNIKIVNPDWLWTCAERWERVDERLFPLTMKARGSRIPPPHCSSPDRIEEEEKETTDRFADSINPLMSFTQEEIDFMDKEVEEDMSDQEADMPILGTEDFSNKREHRNSSDSIDSTNEDDQDVPPKKRKKLSLDSSSDEDSSSESKEPCKDDNEDEDNDDKDDDDDDDPVTRFRRGEDLPSDLDLGDNSQDSVDLDAFENEDEREWNAMGAALEREFLSD